MSSSAFGRDYYATHNTAGDRVALWYYARVVRRLRPGGGRLLDFGCGTGHLLKRLTARFTAFGYDPSPFALEECRRQAPAATVLETWESLPPGSLDLITALHSLEHLEAPAPTLGALAHRLAAGGLLFAVVPNTTGLGHRLKGERWFAYRDPTHYSLLEPAAWLSLLSQAGLEVVSVHGDGLWDPPYLPVLPTWLQRIVFGAPAAVQVFSPWARPLLPPFLGECLVLQAHKR